MSSPFSSNNPLGYTGLNYYEEPPFITANRAPTTQDIYNPGTRWLDGSDAARTIYETTGGGVWNVGGNIQATTTVSGITRYATTAEVMAGTGTDNAALAADVFALAQSIVVGAVPAAQEGVAGIAPITTTALVQAYTDNTTIVTPLHLADAFAVPPAIGGTTPAAGSFTTLAASGLASLSGSATITTGATALNLASDASTGDVNIGTGAGARAIVVGNLTGATGVTINSGTNGVTIISTGAGDIALNSDDALTLDSDTDMDLESSAGSINLTSGEVVADSMTFVSAGGIDITAAGGAASDIDVVNTAGSINLTAGENVADSIVIASTAGGIDITATGAAAGEDIDITASSSINLTSTENAALSIYLHADGGTSETIRLRSDQGTGVASIDILSDVGGVTLTSGLATGDAINIVASNAAGGIDIDAGTAGVIVDTTGAISLDSAAASNFTVTGAFDLTASSTAGSIIISGGEAVADAVNIDAAVGGLDIDVALQMNLNSAQAAADAIRVIASDVAGGIDVDAGTGGIAVDTTGALSLDSAAASNFTVTGAFDLTLSSTAGSVVMTGAEAAVDAIDINASNAAGGIDIDAGTGGITVDTTGALSLDSAAASNLTVTGAFDLLVNSTAGSVNITAGESAADSMVLTNNGMDIVIAGAAGRDLDITNTGGSVNITATENVTDAIVISASGAASAFQVDAGTGSFRIGTGLVIPSTDVAFGDSPYTVLGTDYFISVDTSGGAVTVTLPAATALTGRTFVIRDTGGAAAVSNITIGGGGTNLVGGGAAAATKVLSAAYSGATVYSNGTTWNYAYTA